MKSFQRLHATTAIYLSPLVIHSRLNRLKKKKRDKESTLILLQSNVKNNFSVTIENQNVTHITDTC